MTQAELNKLTVGSTVSLKAYPIFVGEVKEINGQILTVDFLPNTMTHGGDPAPYPAHYTTIEVVKYAEVTPRIPETLINAIYIWQTVAQDLADDIEKVKVSLKL